MRVPILYMGSRIQHLWLTDDPPQGVRGKPVLIDASGQAYLPAAAPGALIFKTGVCKLDFYRAGKAAGYQAVWVD